MTVGQGLYQKRHGVDRAAGGREKGCPLRYRGETRRGMSTLCAGLSETVDDFAENGSAGVLGQTRSPKRYTEVLTLGPGPAAQ